MLTMQTKLADMMPEVWSERFDDDDDGQGDLAARKKRVDKLCASVDLSIKSATERLNRDQQTNIAAEISEADFCLLTSKKPGKVSDAYRRAIVGAPAFVADAVRRQLSLYHELGLFQENVAAALSVLPTGISGPLPSLMSSSKRVLLFTGHMIDAPGRREPRFPPDKVEVARTKIAEAVAGEQEIAGGIAYGVAGGASGGDILFHQVCDASGIATRMFLAVPREVYIRESVAPAGPQWVEDFHRLVRSRQVRVLGESMELPRWLQGKTDYNIWQRNNLWNLHNALAAAGGENVTLIALWNGASGDGPGGTGDMVQKARDRGAKTIILDTKKIF
jgi:hypothetical protein